MAQCFPLYKKNWIQFKRSKFNSCCEVLLPILLAMILNSMYRLTDVIDKASDQTYYSTSDTCYNTQLYPSESFSSSNYGSNADWLQPAERICSYVDYSEKTPETKSKTIYTFKDCAQGQEKKRGADVGGGRIAIVPAAGSSNGPEIIASALKTEFQNAGYSVWEFSSENDIETEYKSNNYGLGTYTDSTAGVTVARQICMAIVLETIDLSSQTYEYTLRYNNTWHRRGVYDHWDTKLEPQIQQQQEAMEEFEAQRTAGVSYLMSMINNFIQQYSTNSGSTGGNAYIKNVLTNVPTPSYKINNLYMISSEGTLVMFFIILGNLIMYIQQILIVSREKEWRIQENLRNMGMSLFQNTQATYLFRTTTHFIVSFFWGIIVKGGFFKHSGGFTVILLYFQTGMYLNSCAFLFSSFFTSSKKAVFAGIIWFLINYMVAIMLDSVEEKGPGILTLASLSPFAAVKLAAGVQAQYEQNYRKFKLGDYGEVVEHYRFITFVIFTTIQTIGIYFLSIYLEMVWPAEFGAKKNACFCCIKKRTPEMYHKLGGLEVYRNADPKPDLLEDVEEGFKMQHEQKKTISIKNLRKEYSNGKVGVQKLNLEMYTDQVFALLGHNGAGKTTTLSMISGLLSPSCGKLNIFGLDIETDSEVITSLMGVCPQINPLYPSLTVREHLELYGQIKGIKDLIALKEEIENLLKEIDLFHKIDYQAGKLSGGQKRKLCFVMALIGPSKIILQDEPTSGMDTYARRHLWDMLKVYKKDKLVILTTHYMDEADYLGDRIGIMGDGKLITCGSSLFLKKKFGVGYDLTIIFLESDIEKINTVRKLISENVKGCKEVNLIGLELKYQQPNETSPVFEKLFKELEDRKEELEIQSFGVSLTTLEEVYLKVARLGDCRVPEPKSMNENKKEADNKSLVDKNSVPDKELAEIRVKTGIFWMHFVALVKKRLIYFRKDRNGIACEIILPSFIVVMALQFTLLNFWSDSPDLRLLPDYGAKKYQFYYGSSDSSWPVLFAGINNSYDKVASLDDCSANIDTTNFQSCLLDNTPKKRTYNLFDYFGMTFDSTNKQYSYVTFTNSTYPLVGFIAQTLMDDQIIKSATGNSAASLKANLHPMGQSRFQINNDQVSDAIQSSLIFGMAFALIPSGIIVYIVKERENNVKHQQIVSGVSLISYWLSNFVVDYLKWLICAAFTFIMILIMNLQAFVKDDHLGAVFLLMLFSGPSSILFTYVLSFLFRSPAKAQYIQFSIGYQSGSVFLLVTFILRIFSDTRPITFYGIEYILRFLPNYAFMFGLLEVGATPRWLTIFELEEEPDAWSQYGVIKSLVYLLLTPFLYAFLIYVAENHRQLVAIFCSCCKKRELRKVLHSDEVPNEPINLNGSLNSSYANIIQQDEDVRKEEEYVEGTNELAIKISHLKKVYAINKGGFCERGKNVNYKVAVKDVTFGVMKGQCFGLLGTNGAGKTTTFKVLTGEVGLSSGDVFINGKNVTTEMNQIRHLIGYCPQFDALLDNLTSREHLELYAAIKGIPPHLREDMIQTMLTELNLKPFENVNAGTYSGGNKRKLSVAIALLGNPSIILLDEPSSGMDPQARRFMWSVIAKVTNQKKQSSVILTTHSIEEAEALSNKLAIQVEGVVKCIGPVQTLKDKYGKGFEIEVKLDLATKDDLEKLAGNKGEMHDNPMTEQLITKKEYINFQKNIGHENLKEEITQNGMGSHIYKQLMNKDSVSAGVILEFVYMNKKGMIILDFLIKSFKSAAILEVFQSFWRFKVDSKVKLSKLFGEIEKNKQKLGISQYSIKQISIEQIFIGFANSVEHDD